MSTRGPGASRVSWRSAALRVAVSAGVLAALFTWLPWPELRAAIGRVSGAVWLGIGAVFLAGHALAAMKWRLLVRAAEVPLGASLALRAHGLGLFANLCLPSLVGGDLVRAGLLVHEHGRAEAVAVASLGDRVNDTFALVVLAGLGALLAGAAVDAGALRLLLAFVVLLPVGVGLAVVSIPRLPVDALPAIAGRIVGRVAEARAALLARKQAALFAFALSLGIQAVFVWLNVRLASAVGVDQPLAVWLLAWPLAKLVALVPISLGGLGVREVALAALLAPFGVEATLAVAQSLAWQIVLIGCGMAAGAAAFVSGSRFVPAEEPR